MQAVFVLLLLAAFNFVNAQKTVSTSSATIKFVSTRNSDVAAVNNQVNASISQTGDVNFNLVVRAFKFDMAEMEEHFNKEYMESDKYPNASFNGKIAGLNKIDFTKAGFYKVRAEGNLSIHNVTRKIVVNGTLRVDRNTVHLNAKFPVNLSDYKIDTGLGGIIIGSKMNVDVAASMVY